MTPKLTNYLREHLWQWNQYGDFWVKDTCSECYSTISMKDGGYLYGEDCPDVWKKMDDFPPDLFFESDEKLIEFLDRLKLTNWP